MSAYRSGLPRLSLILRRNVRYVVGTAASFVLAGMGAVPMVFGAGTALLGAFGQYLAEEKKPARERRANPYKYVVALALATTFCGYGNQQMKHIVAVNEAELRIAEFSAAKKLLKREPAHSIAVSYDQRSELFWFAEPRTQHVTAQVVANEPHRLSLVLAHPEGGAEPHVFAKNPANGMLTMKIK